MTTVQTPDCDRSSPSTVPIKEKNELKKIQLAQSLLFVIVLAVPALLCAFTASVSDPDLWWHLRSAEWIVQHHAVPHTDPFSSFGAGKPWAAYSWLFELVVLRLFGRFGLAGVVLYTTTMTLAITAALYHLIKRLNRDFSFGVLLTFVAALSLWRLDSPRPWHFTILLFILELDILLHARRSGRKRELLWLPVIFALWPNLHIQFIDGLIVLAVAAAESIASRWWPAARTRLSAAWILPISFASLLATLANPYGWGIYKVAHDLAAQPGVLNTIGELQAIPFRSISDYCVLLLALAAAAALARADRVLFFETVLFALAVFLSFRSQRDIWIVSSVAAAIVASSIDTREQNPQKIPTFAWPLIAAAAALVLFAGFRILHVNNQRLNQKLADDLPVHAAEFVNSKHLAGPLYNDYVWGGYLMWALRMPVSIDGRAALHGDERLDRFGKTWAAAPDWASDTELQHAGIVLGGAKSPLTQVLRLDPQFQLVYEDKLAAVFVPRTQAH